MIRILTDSASDILPAEAEQLGVTVIPLNSGQLPQAAHHQPAQPGAVREVLSGSRCRRGRSAGHLPVP